MIEAKAHFDAPERVVHIRVGGLDGRLYLDLGDETWRAVEIDATGCGVPETTRHTLHRSYGRTIFFCYVKCRDTVIHTPDIAVRFDRFWSLCYGSYAHYISGMLRKISSSRRCGDAISTV